MATAVASDKKMSKKVCPTCSDEYPEEDIFCGKDGTRLVSSDPNVISSGTLSDR